MWSHLHSGGKLGILQDIYNYVQSTQSIVFCNTKKAVNSTRDLLGDMGIPCSILHSDLTGPERDDNIKKFRGDIKTNNVFISRVLITTNILARGVDIPTVGLVVNYELPVKQSNRGVLLGPDFEAYAHRIARCGRAGR
jgi:ATP-dependent RNA helicase DDX19/DBP5